LEHIQRKIRKGTRTGVEENESLIVRGWRRQGARQKKKKDNGKDRVSRAHRGILGLGPSGQKKSGRAERGGGTLQEKKR